LNLGTEIKCWLLALLSQGRFELEGNKYEVVDAHNVTSVPPVARLVFGNAADVT
jgi:hypothetical protein